MTITIISKQRGGAGAILVALCGAASLSLAQDSIYSGFDLDAEGWAYGWGVAADTTTIEWDPSVDSKNDPNSGSLKITVNWSNSTSWQELNLQRVSAFDFASYAKVAYDVKVDPASFPSRSGDYNITQIALRGEGFSWNGWHTTQGIVGTNWVHVEELLPNSFSSIVAMNIGFAGNDFTNSITYWLDNVTFVAPGIEPPPTMAIEPAVPGLEMIATGAQYQRQTIRTIGPDYTWINSTGAVNYALTIARAPPAGSTNFFAYVWLIGTDTSDPGQSPDWNEPNGIFLEIRQMASGSYNALLSFKTNAANGHGTRFESSGVLALIPNVTSITGTWSISMNQANATLRTPAGESVSGVLPSDAAPLFASVFPHFGVQMDDTVSKNRSFTFGRVQISGAPDFTVPLDQDFTVRDTLDSTVWVNRAQDASGVQPHPTNTVYKFSWNAPATGYELRSKASLSTPAWSNPNLSVAPAGARKVAFLPGNSLPSATAGFFVLVKP